MKWDISDLIPGSEFTPRNVGLSMFYAAIILVGYYSYDYYVWSRTRPVSNLTPISAVFLQKSQATADALGGKWVSDPQQLQGPGSDLLAPQTYMIDLYRVEPKPGEAADVISGSGWHKAPLSTSGELLTSAIELMGVEGLDAAGAPTVIYMPRYSVHGRVAVTTLTPLFGEAYDATIELDSTNPNVAYMTSFIDPKGPKIVLRREVR